MAASTTHIVIRYVAGENFRGDRSPPFHPFPPGFLPFGPENPPGPTPLVGTFLVLVTIVAITAWHVGADISLHHKVSRRAWYCKLVGTMVNSWQHAGEIIVRRRRSGGPFECGCLPGIVVRSLTLEDAPDKVEVKNHLRRDCDDCCH